jgi:hypothetical protein
MYKWRSAAAHVLTFVTVARAAYPAPPAEVSGGQTQVSEAAPALLRIRIVEGDSAVHTAGTRSTQPIVVFLADETGQPVANASVSVRLPEEGPSGMFMSGLRSEVLLTGVDGRAAIRGVQWNRVAGAMAVRITASKGEARAGIISTQYLTEPTGAPARRAGGESSSPRPQPGVDNGPRSKWVVVAALVGAAAAGGVAAAARGGRGAAPAPGPPPAATTQPPAPTVSIGAPVITVGRP